MRLAGRGGVLERAVPRNPLARLAAGGFALLFVIVAVAAMGSTVVAPSSASCRPAGGVGDVADLPAAGRPFARFYVEAASAYELGERGPAMLAAVHSVETDFGANQGPSSAGAIGHMQFLPATWERYGVDANRDARSDPHDAEDAIHGAANYLRALGAPDDWESALFGYNHADWYVAEVLAEAERFGDVGAAADAQLHCEPGSLASAELSEAVRVYEPARDVMIPARYMAPGFAPDPIDARVWPNVRWVLDAFDLRVTAGKETGHRSHGDGSAIDAVPAEGIASQAAWDRSAGRLAEDLGWTRDCAHSGSRPLCDLAPAIEWIGYDGYPSHGSPATCAGACPAHIHVSWVSATHGTPDLQTPDWVLVFPVPERTG